MLQDAGGKNDRIAGSQRRQYTLRHPMAGGYVAGAGTDNTGRGWSEYCALYSLAVERGKPPTTRGSEIGLAWLFFN